MMRAEKKKDSLIMGRATIISVTIFHNRPKRFGKRF